MLLRRMTNQDGRRSFVITLRRTYLQRFLEDLFNMLQVTKSKLPSRASNGPINQCSYRRTNQTLKKIASLTKFAVSRLGSPYSRVL